MTFSLSRRFAVKKIVFFVFCNFSALSCAKFLKVIFTFSSPDFVGGKNIFLPHRKSPLPLKKSVAILYEKFPGKCFDLKTTPPGGIIFSKAEAITLRVIYADILVTINLAVDYLVLFGTARLAGARFVRLRGLFAAAVGAVYSLCVIFPLERAVLWISRFAVSTIMVLICFGRRKPLELLRLLTVFYACGFVFSGFMLLIGTAAQPKEFLLKNGVVYFEFSALEIVLAACAAFAVTELLRRLFRHGESEGACIAKIYYGGGCAVLKGFTDTGNSLTEPLSGAPVVVCRAAELKKLLPPDMLEQLLERNLSTKHGIRLVPCSTVSGSVLIPAIRPEKLVLEKGGSVFQAEEVFIGFSDFAPEGTLLLGGNIILKQANKSFTEVR